MSGHFEVIPGLPENVLAVSAHGTIDRSAYKAVLEPAAEAIRAKGGKAKLLYVLGTEFDGFALSGMIEDTEYGLSHLHDFSRIAMVTDTGWISAAVKLFGPLVKAPLKVFPIADLDAAKAWITSDAAV